MVDLLNTKWKTFVRGSYYRQFFTFIVYFLLSSFVFIMRPSAPKHTISCSNETGFNLSALFDDEPREELFGSPTTLFNGTEELKR